MQYTIHCPPPEKKHKKKSVQVCGYLWMTYCLKKVSGSVSQNIDDFKIQTTTIFHQSDPTGV